MKKKIIVGDTDFIIYKYLYLYKVLSVKNVVPNVLRNNNRLTDLSIVYISIHYFLFKHSPIKLSLIYISLGAVCCFKYNKQKYRIILAFVLDLLIHMIIHKYVGNHIKQKFIKFCGY